MDKDQLDILLMLIILFYLIGCVKINKNSNKDS
jgi:hypothetical protein